MTDARPSTFDAEKFPHVARFLARYATHFDADGADVNEHDLSAAVKHMVVREDPFPTATIDDLLPQQLLSEVRQSWSELVFWDPADLQRPASFIGTRAVLRLQRTGDPDAVPPPGTVWEQMAQAARDPRFMRPLFEQFADVIESRLATLDPVGEPGFTLWANTDNGTAEALGAHLDFIRQLLTVVLYLDLEGAVSAESPRLWGTALYQATGENVGQAEFRSGEDLVGGGYAAFQPNRAFIMPNSASALHGVAGGEEGVTRRTLMWGYCWYKPARNA